MSIKFFIDQHGCAKNQIDGELIISHLESSKRYEQTFEPESANLIIINSCGFIESAKTECLQAVISARNNFPNAKILLAGCLAERYGNSLRDNLSEADGFFGNGDISKIVEAADETMKDKIPVLKYEQKGVSSGERKMFLSFPRSAFVKITEGCNNCCSFCAIPVIRGNLRSRRAEEIIEEIKTLIQSGIYEINLIGQDLAAYGTGKSDSVFGKGRTFLPAGTPGSDEKTENSGGESALCTLLKMISALEGTFRLRLLYIHPDHFNPDILPVIKSDGRFLPYFDIPFQSGDSDVISKMNRTGTPEKYVSLVRLIRGYFPESAVRTTFLTGFPGETDGQAENSLKFLKEIKADWSGCFTYSREEDTNAYGFKNRVSSKKAEKRAAELTEAQSEITKESLKKRCGKKYDVLVEEVLAENPDFPEDGLAIGRAWFQAPEVDGSVVISYNRANPAENAAVQTGRLVTVEILSSGDIDLNGEFVCDSPLNAKIKPNAYRFAQEQ